MRIVRRKDRRQRKKHQKTNTEKVTFVEGGNFTSASASVDRGAFGTMAAMTLFCFEFVC